LDFWIKPRYSVLGTAISLYLYIEDLGTPLVFEYCPGASEGNAVLQSTSDDTGGVSTSQRRFTYNTIILILFYNMLTNKLPFY